MKPRPPPPLQQLGRNDSQSAMKVLYWCADHGIPLRGGKGASVHVRSITSALARRGHDVTVACRNGGGDNPGPTGVVVLDWPVDAGAETGWAESVLDIINPAVVVERYSLRTGPMLTAARAQRTPVVLEVNAPLVDEAARYRGLNDVEQRRLWESDTLQSASAVIAVSESVARHVRTMGVEATRVRVITNGVDANGGSEHTRDQTRAALGLDGTVVGFSGSLKPWHGVIDLVEAVATLPSNRRALIIGDGPERERVELRAAELGITDRVRMVGMVSHDEVAKLLSAMDIGVAPYRELADFYFSPLKVLEYCAAGLPVIATDQGEMRDYAEAAVLVPPGDVGALAAAIQAIADDDDKRTAMARAGRSIAAARSWDAVSGQVESLLESVI